MVKGISRRVIVVESPDPRVFDQAIFILRNDILSVVDLTARLSKTASYADICYEILHASETYMKGIIGYTRDQVVSIDQCDHPRQRYSSSG